MPMTTPANNPVPENLMLTAFDDQTPNLRWRVLNDGVMGGRSRGGFRVDDGVLLFKGATNTNGGGFSSIRTRTRDLTLQEQNEGLHMRVRGDGRTYTFILESDDTRATYWAFFTTVEDEWLELRIPFTEFWPNWRGMRLSGPQLDKPAITALGIMIYDKQDGDFKLEVDWIKSY
tara:strand:+ start:427 stop:948 length:522 start_codon:yes stop_codon:yes gene_type:complete